MPDEFDNNGFRRFDGDPQVPKKRSVVMPSVVLIVWLAIMFSVLFQEFSATPDWTRVAIISGIGLFGAFAMGRNIIKAIKSRAG